MTSIWWLLLHFQLEWLCVSLFSVGDVSFFCLRFCGWSLHSLVCVFLSSFLSIILSGDILFSPLLKENLAGFSILYFYSMSQSVFCTFIQDLLPYMVSSGRVGVILTRLFKYVTCAFSFWGSKYSFFIL